MNPRTHALALTLLATPLAGQHGQGPVEPGTIRVDGLNLGTHWFGSEITTDDLHGKVVLFEIWGS